MNPADGSYRIDIDPNRWPSAGNDGAWPIAAVRPILRTPIQTRRTPEPGLPRHSTDHNPTGSVHEPPVAIASAATPPVKSP